MSKIKYIENIVMNLLANNTIIKKRYYYNGLISNNVYFCIDFIVEKKHFFNIFSTRKVVFNMEYLDWGKIPLVFIENIDGERVYVQSEFLKSVIMNGDSLFQNE